MENPEFIVHINDFQNQLDAFKRDLADCPELKKKFLKLQSHVEPYQKEIEYLRGEFIKQERLDTLARERVDRIAGEVNGLLAQIQSYEGRIDGIFGMVNGQLQGIWQVQEQIFMDLSQLKKEAELQKSFPEWARGMHSNLESKMSPLYQQLCQNTADIAVLGQRSDTLHGWCVDHDQKFILMNKELELKNEQIAKCHSENEQLLARLIQLEKYVTALPKKLPSQPLSPQCQPGPQPQPRLHLGLRGPPFPPLSPSLLLPLWACILLRRGPCLRLVTKGQGMK